MLKKYVIFLLFALSVNAAAQTQLTENSWYLRTLVLDNEVYESPIPHSDAVLYFSNNQAVLQHVQCEEVFVVDSNATETTFTMAHPGATLLGFGCSPEATLWYFRDYLFYDADQADPKTFSYEIISEDNHLEMIVTNSDGDKAYYANNPLAISESYQNRISFYPNPAHENLMFSGVDRLQNVSIYDIVGHRVMTIAEAINGIDISQLSGGTYIVKAELESGNSVTTKLLKL